MFGRNGEPQLGGATWFLRVLFIISIVFYIVQWAIYRIFKDRYEKKAIWLQTALAVLLLYIGWEGQITGRANTYQYLTCCSMYFVYVAGWLLKKAKIIKELNKCYIGLITLIICHMVLKLVTPEAAVGINANNYSSVEALVVVSIFGTVGCLALAGQINKIKYIKNVFIILGRYSLYIMMFHFLALKLVTLLEVLYYKYPICYMASFPVLETNGFWRWVYIATGCIIPVLVGMGIEQIKKYLKGKYHHGIKLVKENL